MIDGGMLDYGVLTAIPGFSMVIRLLQDGPFGSTEILKTDLLDPFMMSLKKNLPADLSEAIPAVEAARKRFDERYNKALEKSMLKLTGLPRHLLEKYSSTDLGGKLARTLLEIARAGNQKVIELDGNPPPDTGLYDLEKILIEASEASSDPRNLEKKLEGMLQDFNLRRKFIDEYSSFFKGVRKSALAEGVGPEAFSTYVKAATRARNRKMPELYSSQARWNKMWAIWKESKLATTLPLCKTT